jgi:imidazolonepropionase-like amidohydrolase
VVIFENATLIDFELAELRPGHWVTVEGEDIVAVDERPPWTSAERIDLQGRCLMPGLIDAHFHATLTEANLADSRALPPTLMTARAGRLLRKALLRGFTTVRDMGGADWGLRSAVAEGSLEGPRLYIAGRALSQTAGHGDFRSRPQHSGCRCEDALTLMSVVADGKAGVQIAAREQLRQGADHLKVFVSGGVLSPSDPLASAQYTNEELAAIVHEARSWGTYVGAHAYTAAAVSRAAEAGVRTIEHGNLIDAAAGRVLAAHGTFLVPTLVAYEAVRRNSDRIGLPSFAAAKLEAVLEGGLRSVNLALEAGVRLGFGTDLLGDLQEHQSEELLLRARAQSPNAVLAAATSINAEILGMKGRLGTIAPGALADLIVVNGNPLADLGLLQEQGGHLDVIMKGGRFHKRTL